MTTLVSVFENIVTTLEGPLHKKRFTTKTFFSKAEEKIQ